MKVSELEGPTLDYWVAKAAGMPVDEKDPRKPYALGVVTADRGVVAFCPSRDWALGGPIIERERIEIQYSMDTWMANIWPASSEEGNYLWSGPSPLIAAMRAFVASKFGEDVNGE